MTHFKRYDKISLFTYKKWQKTLLSWTKPHYRVAMTPLTFTIPLQKYLKPPLHILHISFTEAPILDWIKYRTVGSIIPFLISAYQSCLNPLSHLLWSAELPNLLNFFFPWMPLHGQIPPSSEIHSHSESQSISRQRVIRKVFPTLQPSLQEIKLGMTPC